MKKEAGAALLLSFVVASLVTAQPAKVDFHEGGVQTAEDKTGAVAVKMRY